MPSEYHPQHCRCSDCRAPSDQPQRSWALEFALATILICALMMFSVGVVNLVEFLSGERL